MKKPKRTNLNPPGKCIFCEGGGLSKEHIFAEWMRPYMEPTTATHHYVTGSEYRPETGKTEPVYVRKGKLHRTGDTRSQKLYKACIPCNTGWMSRLQERAKPLVLPIILGCWPKLSKVDAAVVAAWATMFTMVAESADPATQASSQVERKLLMVGGAPPKDWIVWAGNYEGRVRDTSFWHFGIRFSPVPPDAVPPPCDLQVTFFAAGRMAIVTASGALMTSSQRFRLKLLARKFGFRRVYPAPWWEDLSTPTAIFGPQVLGFMEAAQRLWIPSTGSPNPLWS
jgi:hypothetical protein